MTKFLSLACYACPIGIVVGIWIELLIWEKDLSELAPITFAAIGVSLILSWYVRNLVDFAIARPPLIGCLIGLAVSVVVFVPAIASRGTEAEFAEIKEVSGEYYSSIFEKNTVKISIRARHNRRALNIAIPFGLVAGLLAGLSWRFVARRRTLACAKYQQPKVV